MFRAAQLIVVHAKIIRMEPKNNIKILILLISIILSSVFDMPSCYAFGNKELILSNGSSLISCSINDNKLSKFREILNRNNWSYVSWPSYDPVNEIIYFEAQNNVHGFSRMIFGITRPFNSETEKKIIEGRRPAISPDGSLLCFYRHPNQLWVLNIKTNDSHLLLSNFADYQPTVWISDQSILYSDTDNQLIKFDVVGGKAEPAGHKFIIPGAISPDRKQVLCGSYDGKSIYFYNIDKNEVVKIKKSGIFSMGTSFLWSQDDEQFLYTRQTFTNLIKFNESRSLFLFLSKKKEIELIDKFELFGGTSLK